MQENDFEKQVQQKMEELQFVPSEPVWQKVELQIRQKKTRRRLVLLLLPLLLLGGGAWWYTTFVNEEATAQATTANKPPAESQVARAKPATSRPVEENGTAIKDKTTTAYRTPNGVEKKKISTTQIQQKETKTIANKPNKPIIAKGQKTATITAIEEEGVSGLNEELHALVLQNEIQKRESATTADKTAAAAKNVSKPFWDTAGRKIVVPPVASNTEVTDHDTTLATINNNSVSKESDTLVKEASASPDIPVVTVPKKAKRNWEWTVTGRAGISGLRNGVMEVFTTERAADMYVSPSAGLNNTQSPAFSLSNNVTNSFSFSLGAGLRKKMFQNTFVVAGLQYSRYGTHSYVGNKVVMDTAFMYNGNANTVSGYYKTSGQQKKYTTTYHYIELPLAIEYRLLKKLPLQIQHGVSAGYLFATNALYYDRAASVLYTNDDWLRKVGVQVVTSVDYKLVNTSAFSLFLGPQVQWALTPLQHKREVRQHHRFFAGLQTRITF